MTSGTPESTAPRLRKGVEAVDRALSVLGSFSEHDDTLSLTEISSRCGLYPSTVLRLMESLERGGYVVRLADKSFALGPELLRLGSLYRRRFRLDHLVRPVLQRLSEATGESASYFRREGSRRLCLFRVNSKHSIRDHIEEGELLTLDKGAAGHVLIQFGTPGTDLSRTKKFLSEYFNMKDLGVEDVILGIKIVRNPKGITLSQTHYVEKVLKKFEQWDCKPDKTPFDS